jgi:hypothetical protein
MLIEKVRAPASVLSATTSPETTIDFLLEKLFEFRVFFDISWFSCGGCLAWAGRCRKGRVGKLAMDAPCELYVERVGATAFRDCAKVFG